MVLAHSRRQAYLRGERCLRQVVLALGIRPLRKCRQTFALHHLAWICGGSRLASFLAQIGLMFHQVWG